MTIVVAYTAQDSGTSALELASVLSRSTGEPLAVAVVATFEVRQASSIPRGLLELAADVRASAIVLGSSTKGPLGRISLGSVTDRLVHSAPLPVLLAPRGYRPGPASPRRRVN